MEKVLHLHGLGRDGAKGRRDHSAAKAMLTDLSWNGVCGTHVMDIGEGQWERREVPSIIA
jgi:hypothetical protein